MYLNWYSICTAFSTLRMYPLYDCAHYLLMAVNFRASASSSAVKSNFSKQHPLASWFSTMMLCFAGSVTNCLLFGKPLSLPLQAQEKIGIASAIWYLVNFTPGGGVYSILSSRLGKTLLFGLKEVHRTHGIYAGVSEAERLYPGHYLIYFISGFLKGSSAELMMFWSRLLSGIFTQSQSGLTPNPFLKPSSALKAGSLASLLYILCAAGLLSVDPSILLAGVYVFLVYVRLAVLWGLMVDPFAPLENLLCAILFGGMWDAYKRAMELHNEQSKRQLPVTSNGDTRPKLH